MLIGALANRSGFSRDTIRYYEKRGLLGEGEGGRRDNNYRDYSERALERLRSIRLLKEHGFTLGEIRAVLQEFEAAPTCAGLPETLENKLRDVEERIRELTRFQERLSSALARCSGSACRPQPGD